MIYFKNQNLLEDIRIDFFLHMCNIFFDDQKYADRTGLNYSPAVPCFFRYHISRLYLAAGSCWLVVVFPVKLGLSINYRYVHFVNVLYIFQAKYHFFSAIKNLWIWHSSYRPLMCLVFVVCLPQMQKPVRYQHIPVTGWVNLA